MENQTQFSDKQIGQIYTFFQRNELRFLNVNDYLKEEDFQEIDLESPFEFIYHILNDNYAFNVEVIYYSEAIEYLKKHDCSLTDSLELANEFGYKLEDLNSEILASLLASEITRNAFCGLDGDINEFFKNLVSTQNV